MSNYKQRKEPFKGTFVEIYVFRMPMYHDYWHEAEEMGLVYIGYLNHGPVYYDDEMVFVKKEDELLAKEWFEWFNYF